MFHFLAILILAILVTVLICILGYIIGVSTSNRFPRKRPMLNMAEPDEDEEGDEE